jgi:CheY-like chemotaxis protein
MIARLLIVDDNRSFLEAAGALLEREGLTVAGVASAGDEAIRQAMAAGVAPGPPTGGGHWAL